MRTKQELHDGIADYVETYVDGMLSVVCDEPNGLYMSQQESFRDLLYGLLYFVFQMGYEEGKMNEIGNQIARQNPELLKG